MTGTLHEDVCTFMADDASCSRLGLKHANRQFILYDLPTDLIQITECGPDQRHFFNFKMFPVTNSKKVCYVWVVMYNIGQQRHKNSTEFETNTHKYIMILLLKLRSILNSAFSINENTLFID
jgi:hypothetical protein